jgi:hypothetical protein
MAYTTIDNPELFFQTLIWTGDGSGTKSFTLDGSENMQPDWVWSKARDSLGSITGNHFLYDSVRGAGAEKELSSNSTGAEGANANAQYGYISSFNTDGFTTTAGTSNNDYFNKSSTKYVAWNWKAGGSASSNSDGDVTASVSANTTAGFSIVKFTSSSSSGDMTVGHGLGATPQVVIVKDIGATGNWQVYFEGIGTANQQYLKLNANAAVVNYSGLWGAGMTSSLIGLGVAVAVDASESDIAYCFAEKKGYSKFGTYTGNGNSDGTFVYTGFRPAWVMLKETSGTSDWSIYDNKREPFNLADSTLEANTSDAEAVVSGRPIDMLSNGFKLRGDSSFTNESGATYIYMAFAESPFVNSNGVPNNAR